MLCCRSNTHAPQGESSPYPSYQPSPVSRPAQPAMPASAKPSGNHSAREIDVGNTNVGKSLDQEKVQSTQEAGASPESTSLLITEHLFFDNPAQIKSLLQRGADVDEVDSSGRTPLMHAVMLGNAGNAEVLLDHGANIEAVDQSGRTPLKHAILLKREDLVRLLLARGANTEATGGEGGQTPLMTALIGSPKIVKILLQHGANAEAVNSSGLTPLVSAYRETRPDALHALVESGVDLEATDKLGRTLLMAATNDGRLDVAKLLLTHGANVNAVDKHGDTPLTLAIWKGHVELAKMLLARRANVRHSRDGADFWLLRRASVHKNRNLLHALIKAMPYSDKTRIPAAPLSTLFPKQKAFSNANVEALLRDDCIGILDALIPHNWMMSTRCIHRFAFMYDADENGIFSVKADPDAVLFKAAQGGGAWIALDAIAYGANLHAVDEESGFTPLQAAAFNGNLNVVTALAPRLQAESKDERINSANRQQVNLAMLAAAKAGHMNVVHQLLAMGADPQTRDEDGVSALQHAEMSGHLDKEMLMILLGERPPHE